MASRCVAGAEHARRALRWLSLGSLVSSNCNPIPPYLRLKGEAPQGASQTGRVQTPGTRESTRMPSFSAARRTQRSALCRRPRSPHGGLGPFSCPEPVGSGATFPIMCSEALVAEQALARLAQPQAQGLAVPVSSDRRYPLWP